MNSLELTRYLHNQGFLRKEAAIRILGKRDELIKQATIDLTEQYFGFGKYASSLPWSKATKKPIPDVPKGVMMSKSLKNLLPLLGLAGLVTLGSTAAKVGLGALGDLKTRGELDKSYAGIFKEFPDLKENRGQASKYFAMMSKYAPSLASNPLIAGTWIKQMMNMNVVDPKNIHALISAQSDWEDVRSMKSPLLSFARDFPQTKEIFQKAVTMGAGAEEV